MAEQVLVLEKRTLTGKKVKALRAAGQVPAVIYGGKDFTPVLVAAPYNAVVKAIDAYGYHSPVTLELDGKKQLAMIKDVDMDPVSRQILNVDFRAITASEKVEATAPIVVVNFGDSPAAKAKLNILLVLDEIDVRGKPSDLPKQIEVDGSKLQDANDRLTIADLQLPKGVELVDKELEATTPVANVYDAAAEAIAQEEKDKAAEEAAEAGEVAAEPAAEADAGAEK